MRYETVKIKRDLNGVRHFSPSYVPNIPIKDTDIFVYPLYGDRLDTIANRYYGDSNLWWIIANANPDIVRRDSYSLKPNLEVRIPSNITQILKSFEKINK